LGRLAAALVFDRAFDGTRDLLLAVFFDFD
jgi:hypothetical protein